jgi:hypothetical protein
MSRKSISPIHAARVLHADLCAHRRLVPVAPPADLPIQPGDWTLGVIPSNRAGAMYYYRYCPAEVVYTTGPAVIVGSLQFLAGYALGSLINHTRLRRKARHLAQSQWRSLPLACIAVTNHSLWCHVNQHWIYFDHDAITSYDFRGQALTLSFTSAVPLQLTGPWAPWIAVAIAHFRYGSQAAARISALNTL